MDYELIVIGGGPAGTQCALEFAQNGASVIVLEQGPLHDSTYVPCILGPKLESEFGDYPSDIIDGQCSTYRLIASKDFVDIPASVVDAPHLGHFFNKNAIITWDRQQAISAGASFLSNTRVTSVQVFTDRIEVETTNPDFPRISSEVIALAPGIRYFGNSLQKQLDIPVPQRIQVAWQSYKLPTETLTKQSNEVCIIWASKISHHAYAVYYNTPVGFFIGLLDFGRTQEELARTLHEVCEKHKIIAPLLDGAEQTELLGIDETLEFPREIIKPTFKDRLLVLGDAAGFVNTFVYEGFFQAKVSGRCAAAALLDARASGSYNAKALAGYKTRWTSALDEVNLHPGRASAFLLYNTGKLDTVANALVTAMKREQEAGKSEIQGLFLQNMITPTYSRANDIIWTKAVLGAMSLSDKAVMAPRFLRAAFIR